MPAQERAKNGLITETRRESVAVLATLGDSSRCLICLLPSAFCLLPSAFCLLPSAFYLLPSTFYLLASYLRSSRSLQFRQRRRRRRRAACATSRKRRASSGGTRTSPRWRDRRAGR